MKIMFVTSPGGHLAQLLPLESWWRGQARTWVTFRRPEVEAALRDEQVTWAYFPTTRNIRNAIRNLFLAWPTLRAAKPDVLITVGAGVSVPFFLIARLFHITTVYIECFDRISMPTLSGRICYPMADVFCVQWDEKLRFYPDAVNIGPVL